MTDSQNSNSTQHSDEMHEESLPIDVYYIIYLSFVFLNPN